MSVETVGYNVCRASHHQGGLDWVLYYLHGNAMILWRGTLSIRVHRWMHVFMP